MSSYSIIRISERGIQVQRVIGGIFRGQLWCVLRRRLDGVEMLVGTLGASFPYLFGARTCCCFLPALLVRLCDAEVGASIFGVSGIFQFMVLTGDRCFRNG